MLIHALLFALAFFSPGSHCDHLAWGRERELVYALLVHLFVYFARVNFRPSSLPLGISDWLRLMIVALPGLSISLQSTLGL